METPAPFDPALFDRLPSVPASVLMLDYDGTLAPFQNDRMAATPHPAVRDALHRLIRTAHTHLAVVTGRPLSELEPLLQPPPGVDLWGAHGWERRDAQGTLTIWPQPEHCMHALREAASRVSPLIPAGALERKHGAVVIHTRALGDAAHEGIRKIAREHWTALLGAGEALEWREFNRGFEFRVTLRTKGTVVRTLRQESHAGTLLAYLGDDLTDEDAFAQLTPPDWSVLIAAQPRKSHAQWWMPGPEAVADFLERWTLRFS